MAMSGPVVFQMWMVLLLGTVTGVERAQVSTAKVMRGNIRRDGEMLLFYHFLLCLCRLMCLLCLNGCSCVSVALSSEILLTMLLESLFFFSKWCYHYG